MNIEDPKQAEVERAGKYQLSRYPRRARPRLLEADVGFYARGDISLSGPAMRVLGDPEAVVLFYDQENNAIGIRPADLANPDALRPRKGAPGRHVSVIPGSAFIKYFGLDPRVLGQRRYPARMVDGVLIAELNPDTSD
jgi:hypothetical protein